MPTSRENVFRADLVTGENDYALQTAQSPTTSRRVQSWIPQDDGGLHREAAEAVLPNLRISGPGPVQTVLSGPIVALYQFKQNDPTGQVIRTLFAVARTSFTPGTLTCNLYRYGFNVALEIPQFTLVTVVGTLADAPSFRTIGNTLFMVDGVTNWLFDGNSWILDGFRVPNQPFQSSDTTTITQAFMANQVAGTSLGSISVDANGIATAVTYDDTFGFYAVGATFTLTGTTNFNGTWKILSVTYPQVNDPITGIRGAVLTFNRGATGLPPQSGGAFGVLKEQLAGIITASLNGIKVGQLVTVSGVGVGGYNGTWFVLGSYSGEVFVAINTTGLANSSGGNITPIMGLGPAIDTQSGAGFTCLFGRYYWFTNADETSTRIHESSSSNISVSTGAVTNKSVKVYQTPGLFTSSNVSPTVTASASADNPGPTLPHIAPFLVGQYLYIDGNFIGQIADVPSDGTLSLTLTGNALVSVTNGRAVICDPRSTHWHIYASEADASKVGQYLASVPVTQNLTTNPVIDHSPFIDSANNHFLPIFRPVRNDPPPPSKILEVHKYRLWRSRTSRPNFFAYTANEEVLSGNNGSPNQSTPGADANTLSDIVNETSFPDQSNRIRGIISHSDANYLFSESQCYPLYGESLDDFALSQVTSFKVGIAGRFAGKSTPHGLAFMSYDRKVFLFPTSSTSPYFSFPAHTNMTDSLVEIGKPKRRTFELIDPSRLDEVVMEFYFQGRRNWLILSFPLKDGSYQTWVYDFNTTGWFQLQQGFASLAIFEVTPGVIVLLGGGIDGDVYIVDDLSGTFIGSGNLPNAVFRPALIDFGHPDRMHVFNWLELEFDNDTVVGDITINYWLDPVDVDNPGAPLTLSLTKIKGAARYRGWPQGGTTCHRMLLELNAAASVNPGVLRTAKLIATAVQGVLA